MADLFGSLLGVANQREQGVSEGEGLLQKLRFQLAQTKEDGRQRSLAEALEMARTKRLHEQDASQRFRDRTAAARAGLIEQETPGVVSYGQRDLGNGLVYDADLDPLANRLHTQVEIANNRNATSRANTQARVGASVGNNKRTNNTRIQIKGMGAPQNTTRPLTHQATTIRAQLGDANAQERSAQKILDMGLSSRATSADSANYTGAQARRNQFRQRADSLRGALDKVGAAQAGGGVVAPPPTTSAPQKETISSDEYHQLRSGFTKNGVTIKPMTDAEIRRAYVISDPPHTEEE